MPFVVESNSSFIPFLVTYATCNHIKLDIEFQFGCSEGVNLFWGLKMLRFLLSVETLVIPLQMCL